MSPEGREPLKGERLKKLEFRYVGSIDPADEVEEEVLRRRNKRIRVGGTLHVRSGHLGLLLKCGRGKWGS